MTVHCNPDADFVSSIGCEGAPIQFTDESILGDTLIEFWSWSELNIPFSSNQNPVNILSNTGFVPVKLVITDFFGCVDSLIQNVTVYNSPNVDFNIIPEEIDVYDFKRYENDALGKLEIRKKFRELLNIGFVDVYRIKNKKKQEYTFWDYFAGSWQKNYGMRIDHFLLSNNLLNNIVSININKNPRSKTKPSDHTPIELEIN